MNEQIQQFQDDFGYIDVKEGWEEEEWQRVWDYVANKTREQIANEIEAMKFEPNPNHDRQNDLIAFSYWTEAKLDAERIARGQK